MCTGRASTPVSTLKADRSRKEWINHKFHCLSQVFPKSFLQTRWKSSHKELNGKDHKLRKQPKSNQDEVAASLKNGDSKSPGEQQGQQSPHRIVK